MGRKKVSLALIADNASRRVTLKKRQKGLMQKVRQLSVLCDVPACAVVYEPGNPRPESWPEEGEAKRILTRFKSMPEFERAKKRVDQEGFIRQCIAKMEEQLRRQRRDIWELETRMLMQQGLAGMKSLAGMGPANAKALATMIDDMAKDVRARIQEMEAQKEMMMMMLPSVEVSIDPSDVKPSLIPNPNPNIPGPCPSFWEHEQKLRLGFYGGDGGGYLQDATMQQQPFMDMMDYGGPSSSSWMMMDHAPAASSSSSSFYPCGDF